MVTVQHFDDQLSIYIARLQIWDVPRHGKIIPGGQEVRGLPPLAAITHAGEHRELVLLSRWLQVCRGTMSAVSLCEEPLSMMIFG